jgi:MtN3 and saliva related transmembrane protein
MAAVGLAAHRSICAHEPAQQAWSKREPGWLSSTRMFDRGETMDIVTLIGAVAAILSTTSFMPQAVKIIRTRDTSAISTGMYVVTVLGFVFWTTYGGLSKAWPVMASNSICLILSIFILTMKLLPQHDKEKVADAVDSKD